MSSSGLRPVTSKTSSAICLMIFAARVVVLVDAMAEAHQPALARLDALDERGDVARRRRSPLSIRSTASFAPPCSGP